MLTYNNHDTFQRCLQSMTQLLLDDRVCELIILDNGSHELSLRNLLQRTEKMYSKVKVCYSSENLGIAKGRKFLFDMCKGEYILSFDSDIVVLDANNLLTILLEAFKNPDLWLIGGGGGNHPYFPSLFREYIHNLKEAQNPAQLTVVEEVAGWFHGFRSNMLVKNGGQVYMDEIFSPFWGEDSDFCMQIRFLGGKCAILGAGLVGHKWTSCDKKETQKNIDDMWLKFTNKWYPKFGDTFDFDFDEDFYLANYSKEKKHKLAKVDYLLQGMNRGFIAHPRFLSKLFNIKFENKEIIYEGTNYHPRVFIDKFMNKKEIMKYNFRELDNNIKSTRFLVVYHSDNDKTSYEILKKLKLLNPDFALAFTYVKNKKHPKCLDFIKNNLDNFVINTMVDYHDHTIANLITFENIKPDFEQVSFMHSSFTCAFINNSLEKNWQTQKLGDKIKTDHLTIDAINMVYHHHENLEYYREGIFMAEMKKLKNIVASRSIQKLLNNALLIPAKYSIHLSPRNSPKHSLERLLGHMLLREDNNRTLVIVDAKIESQQEIDICANNNKYFSCHKDTDIMVMNRGNIRHLSAKQLNTDYYYLTQNIEDVKSNWKNAFGLCQLTDYNNVIFTTLNFTIESNIDEFLSLAKYSNISMLEEEDGTIDTNIFSLQSFMVGGFFKLDEEIKKAKKENKEIDDAKSFNFNMKRALKVNGLWISKKIENEDEICIDYYRLDDKYEPDEDYPII